MTDDDVRTAECGECGNEVSAGPGERAVCHGTVEHGPPHSRNVVLKPCANCGKPQTLDYCDECAEKLPGDAMTPTWGKHRYNDGDRRD